MSLPKTKLCRECKQRKPRRDFYLDRKKRGALHTYCRECCKRRAKRIYATSDKAARARVHREWVRKNRAHVRAYKTAHAIGASVEAVKAILARGRCDICRIHGALDPDEAAEDEGLAWAAEGEAAQHPRERW